MAVIVDICIPSDAFELGRILAVSEGTTVVLETMIPLDGQTVPYFRLNPLGGEDFEERVSDHPAVEEIRLESTHDEEALYALEWDSSRDPLLHWIADTDSCLLEGRGGAKIWELELRFDTHSDLSGFQEHCVGHGIDLEVREIYNPRKPNGEPSYGVTESQHEALTRAVREGYYSIPRQVSTLDLAESFDISDQAVSERLRRGTRQLVENALIGDES